MNDNDDKRQPRFLDMTSDGATSPPENNGRHAQQWLRLAHQLSPLVGENGFCALYGRAVRLVRPEFDWLSGNQSSMSVEQLMGALTSDFESVEPAMADTAHTALLNTFTKLLSALIAEALTIRLLLDSALTDEHEQKNAQEQKQ
jgi:hypothetical protein